MAQIRIGEGAEHRAGLRTHEPQDAEMLGAVGHAHVGERRGVPAEKILVVALRRRGAGEVVAVRREPGNGELRGDAAGSGQGVGDPDPAHRPRRAVRPPGAP